MSNSSNTQNLALALTLPHILAPKRRVEYLAEQTVLAALDAYGPAMSRRFLRDAADIASSPLFLDAVRAAALARGIPAEALDTVLGVLRTGASSASSIFGDDGPATDPPRPPAPPPGYPHAFLRKDFVRTGERSVAVMPDGALVLVQKHALLSRDPVTPDVDGITMRVVMRPEAHDFGVLMHSGTARLLAIVPTVEGGKIPLDTDVPITFSPGSHHGLGAESLMSLPDDALNTMYTLDQSNALSLSVIRVDETGEIQALVTALYRPVVLKTPSDAVPPAPETADTPGAVPPAPEGQDVPAPAAKVRRARKRRVV